MTRGCFDSFIIQCMLATLTTIANTSYVRKECGQANAKAQYDMEAALGRMRRVEIDTSVILQHTAVVAQDTGASFSSCRRVRFQLLDEYYI